MATSRLSSSFCNWTAFINFTQIRFSHHWMWKKWILVVENHKNNKLFVFLSDRTDVLAFCAGEFSGWLCEPLPAVKPGPVQPHCLTQEKKCSCWCVTMPGALTEPSLLPTQLSNFVLIPVHLRTAYTGLCGFVWASFICFSQQSGDGTAKSAFLWLQGEKVNADEESSDK